MSQKEVVYQTIISYCFNNGIKREGLLTELTKVQKLEVVGLMVELTKEGRVEVKSEKESKDLKKYWTGCVGNWLKKDMRLNGGSKYIPKTKKGPRVSDEVKELKKLLAAVELSGNEEVIDKVQLELARQLDKEAVEKEVDTAIDASKLPESLRHLV